VVASTQGLIPLAQPFCLSRVASARPRTRIAKRSDAELSLSTCDHDAAGASTAHAHGDSGSGSRCAVCRSKKPVARNDVVRAPARDEAQEPRRLALLDEHQHDR
jgi:hypothetical protein